jgi:hypothetical protein
MAKKTVILIILLGLTKVFQAQESKYKFTVFANPCINWYASDVKSTKTGGATLGYDVGLTMDKYFAENYAFSTGVSIASLNGSASHNYLYPFDTKDDDSAVNIPANTNVKYNLQYLVVPFGLKFKSHEIGYTTIYAHLGLTTYMNINAHATSGDSRALLDNSNISNEINFFNLGYHIGAGVMYSLRGGNAIVAGLTYTSGFVDITDNSKDKVTTRSIAIRLGFMF